MTGTTANSARPHPSQPAPLNDPASYPGKLLSDPCVLTAERVWTITHQYRTDEEWPIRSWWNVTTDAGYREEVDTLLARLDADLMDDRTPVLAVGSAGSPERLRAKMHDLGDNWVIPVTMAEVTGIIAAWSANVARAGHVPWTPAAAPDDDHRPRRFRLLWLSVDQVAWFDRRYSDCDPVELDAAADRVSVRLETSQLLPKVRLYRSKFGAVGDETGQPLLAGDQGQGLELLAEVLGRPITHDDLAGSETERKAATKALTARAVPDGLD